MKVSGGEGEHKGDIVECVVSCGGVMEIKKRGAYFRAHRPFPFMMVTFQGVGIGGAVAQGCW